MLRKKLGNLLDRKSYLKNYIKYPWVDDKERKGGSQADFIVKTLMEATIADLISFKRAYWKKAFEKP